MTFIPVTLIGCAEEDGGDSSNNGWLREEAASDSYRQGVERYVLNRDQLRRAIPRVQHSLR